jgi:hypothetical protein
LRWLDPNFIEPHWLDLRIGDGIGHCASLGVDAELYTRKQSICMEFERAQPSQLKRPLPSHNQQFSINYQTIYFVLNPTLTRTMVLL